MKLILISLALFIFAAPLSAQSVVVTSKKMTYTRPKPIQDFKKTFTVVHPKVKAATPALSKKIESAIGYKTVLDLDISEEINEVQWLEEANFEVLYNSRGLLCVRLFITGTGAYPSSSNKTVVVDLKNGTRVNTSSAFVEHSTLIDEVNKKQKLEIEKAIAELRKDPDRGDEDLAQLFAETNFETKDLDHFSIDDNGVTFIYDYGFPHVIQAWEPDGRFKFTWAEIAGFVNKHGPFASFVVK
jgi:hypothetical protein